MTGPPSEAGTHPLLLGRNGLLRAVRSHTERARAGHGGLVLITGGAGLGKTSLAGRAVQEARHRGMAVLRGSCWDADGTPGYWPWTQVVRGLRSAVRAEVWEAASDAARLACRSLPGSGSTAGEVDLFRVSDAVTTVLATAAQRQPVLVVLEDLHRADAASVALLEFAVQHLSLERVLIVATVRDVEAERPDHPLCDPLRSLTARATTLALTGLGAADVTELMRRTAERTPDEALVGEVLRRTGGNPFLVQEIARRWAAGHDADALPPGPHASLRQRPGRPDDQGAECPDTASGPGRPLHAGTPADLAEEFAARVGRWPARTADARPVEHDRSAGAVVRHELVRETPYGGPDAPRARRLHAAAADAPRNAAAADMSLPAESARHALGPDRPGAAAPRQRVPSGPDAGERHGEATVRHLVEARRPAGRVHAPPWSPRARAAPAPAPAPAPAARGTDGGPGRPYEFRRDGGVWRLTYEGRTVYMPDAKGLRDLHCLLSRPGRDIPSVRLLSPREDVVATAYALGADEVLDDEARRRYRRHLERLDAEIDRAVERGDERRAAAHDRERAALLEELRRCTGLGGRARRLGDPRERARKNVTARIRHVLRRLDGQHPELAAHLRRTVSTGTMCRYTPEQDVRWQV